MRHDTRHDRRAWQVTVPHIRTYIDHVRRLRHPASGARAVGNESAQVKSNSENEGGQQKQEQIVLDGIIAADEPSRGGGKGEARRWSC